MRGTKESDDEEDGEGEADDGVVETMPPPKPTSRTTRAAISKATIPPKESLKAPVETTASVRVAPRPRPVSLAFSSKFILILTLLSRLLDSRPSFPP